MSGAVHGTAVAIGGWAVLLTGKSGAGKSDLALRLIDRGAKLVCDDYVDLVPDGAQLIATVMDKIAGKIEIRALGIFDMPYVAEAPLRLIVELGEDGERLPEPGSFSEQQGYAVPVVKLNAFAASAAIKVEYALKSLIDDGCFPVRRTTSEAKPETELP
jgi:HPr kinase/phosphorylase